MKKLRVAEILSYGLAAAAIFVSIGGFFNILPSIGLNEESLPRIILGLIGVMIINAMLERKNDLKRLDEKLDKIISLNTEENLSKLGQISKDIDPTLQFIFKDFISDTTDFFHHAIKNQKIQFNDLNRFKKSYQKTLELKKQATFYATSLPYKDYFWVENEETNPMMESMKKFVTEGGSFERIFFLEDGDMEKDEVIGILNKQLELKIKVFTIPRNKVPEELNFLFVVDSKAEVAWKVSVNREDKISATSFYTAPRDTRKFHDIYESLKALDYLKPYNSNHDVQ